MAFDIQAAKQAGYSDQEIADYLAQQGNFDAASARKAGYSDQDIAGHLAGSTPQQSQIPAAATKPEFNLPGVGTVSTPPSENGFNLPAAVISAGRTLDRVNQGVTQLRNAAYGAVYRGLGLSGPAQDMANSQAQQKAYMQDADKRFAQLQDVHPGSTLIGGTAPLLPLNAPMLFTAAGLSYGSPTERLTNMGGVALGNAAADGAATLLAKQRAAATLQQSQNAVKDATLTNAQAAGLRVPPSTVNPSFVNRSLEGIAGKQATQQDVSLSNSGVVNDLLRKDVGLPAGSPITPEALRARRADAYQSGYAPIANAGQFNASPEYGQALDAITAKSKSASQSFPGADSPDVRALVDSYRPPQGMFDAGHALDAAQGLRDQASDAFASGQPAIGTTKIAISNAILDEVERQLSKGGQDGAALLQNFRNARQLMAKTHTLEDALRIGSGEAEASALGRAAQAGVPLSGAQKTIGDFANNFSKAVQKPSQIGSPGVSKLDAVLASGTAALGAHVAGPVGLAAGAAVPFVVPPVVRSVILSKPYQMLMARQRYPIPGLLADMVNNPALPRLGGLLGYQAGN